MFPIEVCISTVGPGIESVHGVVIVSVECAGVIVLLSAACNEIENNAQMAMMTDAVLLGL